MSMFQCGIGAARLLVQMTIISQNVDLGSRLNVMGKIKTGKPDFEGNGWEKKEDDMKFD